MGEYEPTDSRKVTLEPGHEPGSAERTGPREDEAREKALEREREEREERAKKDTPDPASRSQYDPAERTGG